MTRHGMRSLLLSLATLAVALTVVGTASSAGDPSSCVGVDPLSNAAATCAGDFDAVPTIDPERCASRST